MYGEDETFILVRIPSCVPFLAASIWLQMIPVEGATFDSFLWNIWAAQTNLFDNRIDLQKTWEAILYY